MKTRIFVVVLVFAVTGMAQTPAQTKSGSVEQELIKLESDWNEAMVKRDVAFLDRILADNWMSGQSDGTYMTKAQFIANVKSGDVLVSSAVFDDFKVRVYGDAAVFFCHYIEKSKTKGIDSGSHSQWTDTWVKIAGRWQCVAGNGSKIEQK